MAPPRSDTPTVRRALPPWVWAWACVGLVVLAGAWGITGGLRHAKPAGPGVAGPAAQPLPAAAPSPPGAPGTQGLSLSVQALFNGEPLRLNEVRYRTAAGDLIGFTRLALLLTQVALVRADGSIVGIPEADGYIDIGTGRSTLHLPTAPAGVYRRIRFNVGVDPERNHADPSVFPARHPLNPLVNGLHWDWTGGYVFMALEGRHQVGGNQPGRLGGFVYHLAGDEHLMAVDLPVDLPIDLQATRQSTVVLAFDLATLLNAALPERLSVTRATDRSHSSAGDSLVQALVKNVPGAFRARTATELENAIPVAMAGPGFGAAGRVAPPGSSPDLAPGLTPVRLAVPAGFPQPDLPGDNPLSAQGIELGRRLFFDPLLSINRSQSCAACHAPGSAFSDTQQRLSVGATGQRGTRNAQPLFNLAWADSFTWDGRRRRLRDQALAPISDHSEMALPSAELLRRLNRHDSYRRAFRAVFNQPVVTDAQVGLALEQFMLSLVSADSRFDRALRREASLSTQEKEGLRLFLSEHDPARGVRGADCFHCHGGPLFSNGRFHNNGLDQQFKDRGRALVTGRDVDEGLFKTPSLRNVALTAPYMHDGRFKTLAQVVDHYSTGTQPSPTLDPNIAKHPNQAGVDLNAAEKAALVAFLKTLTDERFAQAPGASGPGRGDRPLPRPATKVSLLRRPLQQE